MKTRELSVKNYHALQKKLRSNSEYIEEVIPQEIAETEEKLLKNSEWNALGLIVGGIATSAGILIGNFLLSALGVISGALITINVFKKYKYLRNLHQSATQRIHALKYQIRNAWKIFKGRFSKSRIRSRLPIQRKTKYSPIIAGIFAKLGDLTGINPWIFRIPFMLTFGLSIPLYLVLSVIVYALEDAQNSKKRKLTYEQPWEHWDR